MQEHLFVYQRAGEPCFRCGHPVRRIVIGARSTHFCSWCQRLPVGDKPGAAAILRDMEPKPGSTPRSTESRADRTKRAAATRRAAARAVSGTRPDTAQGA